MSNDKLFYCPVWSVVWTPHGMELPIKEHRGWKYVNYQDKKIGLAKIPHRIRIRDFDDFQFCYIFEGWFFKYPCPAMDTLVSKRIKQKR